MQGPELLLFQKSAHLIPVLDSVLTIGIHPSRLKSGQAGDDQVVSLDLLGDGDDIFVDVLQVGDVELLLHQSVGDQVGEVHIHLAEGLFIKQQVGKFLQLCTDLLRQRVIRGQIRLDQLVDDFSVFRCHHTDQRKIVEQELAVSLGVRDLIEVRC